MSANWRDVGGKEGEHHMVADGGRAGRAGPLFYKFLSAKPTLGSPSRDSKDPLTPQLSQCSEQKAAYHT